MDLVLLSREPPFRRLCLLLAFIPCYRERNRDEDHHDDADHDAGGASTRNHRAEQRPATARERKNQNRRGDYAERPRPSTAT